MLASGKIPAGEHDPPHSQANGAEEVVEATLHKALKQAVADGLIPRHITGGRKGAPAREE
jgi:hypothetical protein